jgi:hypothetical protein
VHLAALVDRDVFTDQKALVGEVEADIVGQLDIVVIVKSPTATRPMDEMAELILFVRALPRDPAWLAMRPLQFGIDTAFGVHRRNEDIGDLVVAVGMTGLPGQRNTDLPELRGQGGIEDRL